MSYLSSYTVCCYLPVTPRQTDRQTFWWFADSNFNENLFSCLCATCHLIGICHCIYWLVLQALPYLLYYFSRYRTTIWGLPSMYPYNHPNFYFFCRILLTYGLQNQRISSSLWEWGMRGDGGGGGLGGTLLLAFSLHMPSLQCCACIILKWRRERKFHLPPIDHCPDTCLPPFIGVYTMPALLCCLVVCVVCLTPFCPGSTPPPPHPLHTMPFGALFIPRYFLPHPYPLQLPFPFHLPSTQTQFPSVAHLTLTQHLLGSLYIWCPHPTRPTLPVPPRSALTCLFTNRQTPSPLFAA